MRIDEKRWFIDRIVQELNKGGATRATHQNTSDVREMQGYQRSTTPSRLRRFT